MKALLAIIALYAVNAGAAPDTSGYAYFPQNGHYYKAVHVPQGISWTQAKNKAEQAGGYLATITSPEENIFIFKLINNDKYWTYVGPYDSFGPWIGGYQKTGGKEPDHDWCWVTGEEFFYANWAAMEPSGRWMSKDENRLQLYNKSQKPGGKWNDALDSPIDIKVHAYVIEKGSGEKSHQKTVITEPKLELHAFASEDGKTCEGSVIAYNAVNDTVVIEKKDKKKCKVDLSKLSTADQIYVREWNLIREFCRKNNIRVSAKQKKFGKEREVYFHDNQGNKIGMQTLEDVGYDIMLESRILTDLPNVKIDYCMYYEQDHASGKNRVIKNKGVKCGTLNIGTLTAKARIQLESQPVILFKSESLSDWTYKNEPEGNLQGIWIRVYLSLSDGSRAMLEHSFPNTIMEKRTWAESSIPTGMNKKQNPKGR